MPKIVPIHYERLCRVFELDGFSLVRVKGDHFITKPGILRPVVISKDDQVPVFVITNNLRTAKLSRDRYFDLLAQL
jgi:predicted RNA binding protein YcfA (HicA-like mRNA interferase family)